MTKIIANYLPQYHCIPENDKWWGKGYTDWVAVKKSVSLYKGHKQPKIPKDNNYYNLNDVETIRWQVEKAKKNGIDGFGIYHYWFNDSLHLLDTPPKLLKDNKDIKIEYMFIWDNSSWVRSWSNIKKTNDWAPLYEQENKVDKQGRGILAELIYGGENSWKLHFDYLLDFFKDERYIKIDNKPVFAIFNQNNDSDTLVKMFEYWDKLAVKNGFNGIYIIGKRNNEGIKVTKHEFLYQPEWSGWLYHNKIEHFISKIRKEIIVRFTKHPLFGDYDKIWNKIIKCAESNINEDVCFSGFVSYDDTPRRGKKGRVIKNASPVKFEKYIEKLIKISKNKPFLFITAWNEWGEGAYLEPDEENGLLYLESLKRAVDNSFENETEDNKINWVR